MGGERAIAKKLNIVWDTTNNCADPMHIPPTVNGVQVWKERGPLCMYCGKYPSGTRNLKYTLVYNDVFADRPAGLCYFPFCVSCGKWWIGANVEAMRLSNIFHNLTTITKAYSLGMQIQSITPWSMEDGSQRIVSVPQLYCDILEDKPVIKLPSRRASTKRKRKQITRKPGKFIPLEDRPCNKRKKKEKEKVEKPTEDEYVDIMADGDSADESPDGSEDSEAAAEIERAILQNAVDAVTGRGLGGLSDDGWGADCGLQL
jgi:hypothetical protein